MHALLHEMQQEDSATFPTLAQMAYLVPEGAEKPHTKDELTALFASALDTAADLTYLWRDVIHGLEFTDDVLRRKFETWRDADPVNFPVLLQALHPIGARRPEAAAILASLAPVPADAKAQVGNLLGGVKGKAFELYEEYAAATTETDHAPRASRRNSVGSMERSGPWGPPRSGKSDKP